MKERRSFAELQAEYRRAILLRFLSEDADYAMDTGLLKAALKSVGHGVPLRQGAGAEAIRPQVQRRRAQRQQRFTLCNGTNRTAASHPCQAEIPADTGQEADRTPSRNCDYHRKA